MNHSSLPHHHGEREGLASLQHQLEQTDHFQIVAEIFKQLSDPTRIRIFWLLCHCEECVINLSALLNMSSPAVSHHLRALKDSGLILSRRDGKEVHYRAADTEQSKLLHEMIEQVMEISCPESTQENDIARQVHDELVQNMDRRITIEELARSYHVNPTTLKASFKAVYGSSLAAHMREHRMERAAKLLRETDKTIAEIGQAVGYDSQSKFTAAFKAAYGLLPTEYRRSRTA